MGFYAQPVGGGNALQVGIGNTPWGASWTFEAGLGGSWNVSVAAGADYFPDGPPGTGSFECHPEDIGGMTCTVCSGDYGNHNVYASQGSIEGIVAGVPTGMNALVYWCYSDLGPCPGYTPVDASGKYYFVDQDPVRAANNWGLSVACEPGCPGGGSRVYWLTAGDLRPVPVTVTSSQRAYVPLFIDDPSIRACPGNVHLPVNVASGNAWLDQSDARLPGVGPAIEFTRSYNSANTATGRYGVFGPGWTHSYERRVDVVAYAGLRLRSADGVAQYYSDEDGDGTYVAVAPPDETSTFTHQPDGSYLRHFRAGGSEAYAASGRLISLSDAVGNSVNLTYDASGRLTTLAEPGGRSLTLTYEGSSTQIRQLLGPGGLLLATYTYQGALLHDVEYPDSSDLDTLDDGGYGFTYDAWARLATITDLAGRVVEKHSYDSQGRAETSELANDVEKHRFVYEGQRTRVLTRRVAGEPEDETVFEWSQFAGMRRLVKQTGACSSCGGGSETQEWTYDDKARVATHKTANEELTKYEYDPVTGDLLVEENPLGKQSYTYYPDGRVKTRTAYNGQLTTWTYVAAGPESVTEQVAAGEPSRVTSFTYTGAGQLETVTDARGKLTRFTYEEPSGDLASVADPLGSTTPDPNDHVTRFEYDGLGRRTAVIDPLGQRTETSNNSLGQVWRVRRFLSDNGLTRNLDTLFEHDQGGRRTSVTDANSRRTDYDYDAYGRLWHAYQPELTPGGERPTTTYGYDLMSNLATLEDAEQHTTTFEYATYNRLHKITYPGPEVRFEEFTYDLAGRLWTRRDRRGVVTTYHYDGLDRLTSKTYSDGTPALNYRYDENGDAGFLTGADQGGLRRLAWDYDLAGQLRSERYYADGSALTSTVSYTYDATGNRKELWLDGQIFTSYDYDDASRLTALHRNASTFGFDYDDAHRRTLLSYPNLVSTINAYDDLSRLTAIDTLRNRTPVLHAGYTYDDAGNRLGKSLLEWSESYQYDALDRLEQVDRGAATTERYTYDKVGNRKTSLEFSDWTYNARNELGSYGARTLTYDENGNTKTSSEDGHTRVYEWNPENQLTRVTQDAAEVARFNYDPLGRRVEKVAGGATTTYVYDGADILRRVSAGTTVRYVHGPGIDEPLAIENGAGQLTFEHADALGSELKQTDGAGAVTFSRSYDAFGQLQTGATTAGYAFTGREWDPETGIYYYRARYYDPRIGRFLSEDPIGFEAGVNFYSYVENNPTNLVDPFGLDAGSGMQNLDFGNPTWGDVAETVVDALSFTPQGAAMGGAWRTGRAANRVYQMKRDMANYTQALRKLDDLRKALARACSPKTRKAIQQEIDRLLKWLRGHRKKMCQVWGCIRE